MAKKSTVRYNEDIEQALVVQYLNDIGQTAVISKAEEELLFVKIAKGDSMAINRIVNANLKFVVSIAKEYNCETLSILDIIEEGNIGLIKAVNAFNPKKGVDFRKYAVWHIRKAIEQAINKNGTFIGNITVGNQVVTRKTAEQIGSHYPIQPGVVLSAEELEIISNALQLLPEREKIVLSECYGINGDMMTMQEIANKHGLKRERVRQIRNRGLRRLWHNRNITDI